MEIENCQTRGQVSLGSRNWLKNHRMDILGPGRDWQDSKRPPDQTLFLARNLESYVESVEAKRKAKVGHRKTEAWQCQKIAWFFIDPADAEFKEIMKNARRKLDVPMPAAMLCRSRREEYRDTCSVSENVRQNTHALLKPTNLRESVWTELFIKVMKIILQGKEWVRWTTTILCTHIFLCLK